MFCYADFVSPCSSSRYRALRKGPAPCPSESPRWVSRAKDAACFSDSLLLEEHHQRAALEDVTAVEGPHFLFAHRHNHSDHRLLFPFPFIDHHNHYRHQVCHPHPNLNPTPPQYPKGAHTGGLYKKRKLTYKSIDEARRTPAPLPPPPHTSPRFLGGLCSFLPDEAEAKKDVEEWRLLEPSLHTAPNAVRTSSDTC
jgi:hypothetical protein